MVNEAAPRDADRSRPERRRHRVLQPSPGTSDVQPRTIVFNGVLDYRPNLDAALFLVDEVLPIVRESHPESPRD